MNTIEDKEKLKTILTKFKIWCNKYGGSSVSGMNDNDIDTYLNIGFLKTEKENNFISKILMNVSKAKELTLIAHQEEIEDIESQIRIVAKNGLTNFRINNLSDVVSNHLRENGFNVQNYTNSDGTYYVIMWMW
jgi:hypothetical protein